MMCRCVSESKHDIWCAQGAACRLADCRLPLSVCRRVQFSQPFLPQHRDYCRYAGPSFVSDAIQAQSPHGSFAKPFIVKLDKQSFRQDMQGCFADEPLTCDLGSVIKGSVLALLFSSKYSFMKMTFSWVRSQRMSISLKMSSLQASAVSLGLLQD